MLELVLPGKKEFTLVYRNLSHCLVVLFLVVFTARAAAGSRTIVVKEQLNQTYGRELLSYPFSAAKGSCVVNSLQLIGPDGPVPVQLSNIVYWSAKQRYVKSAILNFVVNELKPLTTVSYTVKYGTAPVKKVDANLYIKKEKNLCEFGTDKIAIRFLNGQRTYPKPVLLKDVPGPLAGMRFAKGQWAGGSKLSGKGLVREYRAVLTGDGPVFGRSEVRYTFADGNVVTVTATVIEGDNTVRWQMFSRDDRTEAEMVLRLLPIPDVKQALVNKVYGIWGGRPARKVTIVPGDKPFLSLIPASSIVSAFPSDAPNICLVSQRVKGLELWLRSSDPGFWAGVIAPFTYAGCKSWNLKMIDKMWQNWKRKAVPVSYAVSGEVRMKINFAKGGRKWWISAGKPLIGERLNVIKDMVLDWPENSKKHPHPNLFADMKKLKETWEKAKTDPQLKKTISYCYRMPQIVPLLLQPKDKRSPKKVAKVVKVVRNYLGALGKYDVMRVSILVATLYDLIIDSDLISAKDKKLFRAQMAYLAYMMAEPHCWSLERGYITGNPNMSVSHTLSLGVIACAIPDHPKAGEWADYATKWMKKWLTDEVGPNGVWIPEGSHYGNVSLEPMVAYAIAAKRAGFYDFSKDPRLKKMLLYFSKYHTPRDIQRKGKRSLGSYGRGHGGCLSTWGAAAAFYKKSDPALSRTLQWLWKECQFPPYMSDSRMGGCDPYYAERNLPVQAPKWQSELFPRLGVVLRHGFNTPSESYLNFLCAVDSERNLDIWTPGVGGISQWFGRGKPLSSCFTFECGYPERHELLRDGVRLARNWGAPGDKKTPFGYYTKTDFATFAPLPRVDYVRSTFTNTRVDDRNWFPKKMIPAFPKVKPATSSKLKWTRQLLFVKDVAVNGPAYIVLRDTTSGGQPTTWQFRTLSEKIGTPEQVKERKKFLSDKPGKSVRPARKLPDGDRYTAVGQFGVDIEYFVVAPAATPRYTVRYGGTCPRWPGNSEKIDNYQDLFMLQLPGDGFYYVVIYPRPEKEAVPQFSKLAGNKIIKINGTFGTDYLFLALDKTRASADKVSFNGTAATVQLRPQETIISLAAKGEAAFGKYAVAGPGALSLRIRAERLEISLPENSAGGLFSLRMPGEWRLETAMAGVKLEKTRIGYNLRVPPGSKTIYIYQKK